MATFNPSINAAAQPAPAAITRSARIPWSIWAGVAAVTSASIGGAWDVSWHRSIGRDTFWTPAHMAIYACGVLAGIVGVYLVLAHHLRPRPRTARRLRQRPRPPRSARRLPRRLGRRRHAHLRALRQLVAQRLRPRRQDRQPAAHPADPRHPRRRRRHAVPHPRRHEPRSRRRRRPPNFSSACRTSSSTSAASPSAARCSSCRSTPGTSCCTAPSPTSPWRIALPVLLRRCSRRPRASAGPPPPPPPSTRCVLIAEILILPLFPAQPKLGPVFNPGHAPRPRQVPHPASSFPPSRSTSSGSAPAPGSPGRSPSSPASSSSPCSSPSSGPSPTS